MASHSEVVDRLGQEINNLQAKMEKEADRRLQLNFKQRIEKIKNFLQNKLPEDQKASAESIRKDAIEDAGTYQELKDIEVAHNMSEGDAVQEKYGGSLAQSGYGNQGLYQNGWGQALTGAVNAVGGAVGNTLSNTTSNISDTISAVGNTATDVWDAGTSGAGSGNGLGANIVAGGQAIANTDLNPFIEGDQTMQNGIDNVGLGNNWSSNPYNPNNTNGGGGAGPDTDPDTETPPDAVPQQNSMWSGGVNNQQQTGGGYKLMHDAYYGHGGHLQQHGYEQALLALGQAGGAGAGFMKSKEDGGVWGNERTTKEIDAAQTAVGMVPGWGKVASALTGLTKIGTKLTGGSEFWNPAGAQMEFLKRDEPGGKRDWKGLAASLVGGPLGSFMYNTRKDGAHTQGGLVGMFSNDERAEARWQKRQDRGTGKERRQARRDRRGEYGMDMGSYAFGGQLPQHEFDVDLGGIETGLDGYGHSDLEGNSWNPDGTQDQWGNIMNGLRSVDWGQLGNRASRGAQDGLNEAGEAAPLYSNMDLLNSPGAYIENVQYNPMTKQFMDDLNEADIMSDDVTRLAYNPDQMDVDPYLNDIDNAYNDYLGNQNYFDDPGMAMDAQRDAYGTKLQGKADTRRQIFQENLQLGGRDAQMLALSNASNLKRGNRQEAYRVGEGILGRDDAAFTHNLLTDAARNNIRNQLAMDTSEFTKGNYNDDLLENALDKSGQFYNFDGSNGGLQWNGQGGYGLNWDDIT